MSSIFPIVLKEMIRPMRMMEQQMRIMQEELRTPHYFPSVCRGSVVINRPWHVQFVEDKDANVVVDKEKFQVKMDVQHFQPEEITVKMSENNTVIVEAKHEEKADEKGFISRQVIRKFLIPEGHDLKQVVSNLSSDGVLTITAPRNPEAQEERVIPITQTGPAKEENQKIETEKNMA